MYKNDLMGTTCRLNVLESLYIFDYYIPSLILVNLPLRVKLSVGLCVKFRGTE